MSKLFLGLWLFLGKQIFKFYPDGTDGIWDMFFFVALSGKIPYLFIFLLIISAVAFLFMVRVRSCQKQKLWKCFLEKFAEVLGFCFAFFLFCFVAGSVVSWFDSGFETPLSECLDDGGHWNDKEQVCEERQVFEYVY